MSKREHVIKALKFVVKHVEKYDAIQIACNDAFVETLREAIYLLREQEPIKPKETGFHMPISISINYECKCGAPMLRDQPFCMKCGRPVKWE